MSVLFSDEDYLDTRQFSTLHKIVLGLVDKPLQAELDVSTSGVDAVDAYGYTSLSWAAARNDSTTIKVLLDAGADANVLDNEGGAAIFKALTVNGTYSAQLLLEHGVDISMTTSLQNLSLLHVVCIGLKDDCVLPKLLIEAGVGVNMVDVEGRTALHYAAQRNHLQSALCLLGANANTEIACSEGHTPLLGAVLCQADLILQELVKRKANHKALNKKRQGLLHLLAREGTKSAMLIVARE